MVGAQDPLAVGQILLVQGDRLGGVARDRGLEAYRRACAWRNLACMGTRISTLHNVKPLDGGRYAILLIEWNDYAYPVREELNRQVDAFGMDLGPSAVFFQPYAQRMYAIGEEVVRKPWPPDIVKRFESDQDPTILVLERDWDTFDPREHPYGIIWASMFSDKPEEIRSFLQELALHVRRGDLIMYLRDVATRQQRAATLDKTQKSVSLLARLASYIEIKPGVFGVTIDLSTILRDISERHH